MATFTVNVNGTLEVLTGLTLWVDSVNGNDGTAVRGDLAKPYLTPNAAKTAAALGDNIIVLPGQYSVTSNLGKDGVNWFGYPGAHLLMTSTTANQSIFSDEGNAMGFVVEGAFTMQLTTTSGASGEGQWTVFSGNAGSNITIRCNRILHVGGTSDPDAQGAVYSKAGTVKIECAEIDSSGANPGMALSWGVGDMNVKADRITSGAVAIQSYATSSPPGEFFVDAQYIASTSSIYGTIQDSTTDVEGRTWIRAGEIVNSAGSALVLQTDGFLYVSAQKIGGGADAAAIAIGGFNVFPGTNWIIAEKISSSNKFITTLNDTTSYINCQDYEDNGVSVGIEVSGSVLNLDGGHMVLTAANGIEISGGTCYAKSLTIDTSADSGSNPIVKSGGTLTIAHCHLIAEGAVNSIEAPTAQSVTNVASYSARPVDGDVTLIGYPIDAPSSGLGDVVGPAGATDNAVALYNGTTGKLLKDGPVLGTLATQNGTFSGNSSGNNTGDQTTVSGNAGSATQLQTSRNINGVGFNGSADIIAPVPFCPFILRATTAFAYNDLPNTAGFFQGSAVASILPADLTYFKQARIFAYTATTGSAGSKLSVKYKTGAWSSTAGDYSDIGTSEVACTVAATNTFTDSGWINLAAGAKAEIHLSIFGVGGNGTADPTFNIVGIQFR